MPGGGQPSPSPGSQSSNGAKKSSRPSQTGASAGGQGSRARGSQPGSAGGLGSNDSPGDADLASRAALFAESGLTLQDLLEALASMESQGDSEAPQEVRRLLSDGELPRVVDRMEGIERLVRKADASVDASGDSGDRRIPGKAGTAARHAPATDRGPASREADGSRKGSQRPAWATREARTPA